MKFEIANKFSDAENFNKPISKRPFESAELIALLNQTAAKLFPPDRKRNAFSHLMTQLKVFQRFLKSTQRKNSLPDESLLEKFRLSLVEGGLKEEGGNYGVFYANSAVDSIRRCFNQYLYPQGLIERPILTKKVYDKYSRFFSLTETTRKLIVAFEEDGRSIVSEKKYYVDSKGSETCKIAIRRKAEKLSSYNRKCYLGKVLALLTFLEKKGIEDLTKDDLQHFLQQYSKRDKEQTAHGYLAALYSLVANGVALKLLQQNPFEDFPLERKKTRARQDFIMPDQINKVLDLESLDWKNPKTVRERCVTALIYDTGLRASTIALLRVSDIRELSDGRYQIMVQGSFLKGNKQDVTLYVLFEQMIPLLRSWIHMARPIYKPKTDCLFVSREGKNLTRTGIRNIVRNCCKSLGIQTAKGRTPSPHTLRHTLATLNTAPYGKALDPSLMQKRLIHMDFETLTKIYVHNNPLAEMEEYKRLLEKDSVNSRFCKISQQEFFELLDTLRSAKQGSILDVKRAYELEFKWTLKRAKGKDETSEVVSEQEAVKKFSNFKIGYRSLRAWGLKEGFCHIKDDNGLRRYMYEKTSIDDLLENHIERDEALRKFHSSRAGFYRRMKKCRIVTIGQRFFIPKDDFLRFLVEERSPALEKVKRVLKWDKTVPLFST